eukprot:jgi/Psemu1/315921/fgenesh1_kg.2548_\
MSTIPLPRNHTLPSIHRAQLSYERSLQTKNSSAEYFSDQSKNHDDDNPRSKAYAPPLICNAAVLPLRYLPHYYVNHGLKQKVKFRCVFWMTEQPYSFQGVNGDPVAKKVYTIVREPMSHVLSQYFHCTESSDHVRKRNPLTGELLEHHKKMPSLDVWLTTYARLARMTRAEKIAPFHLYKHGNIEALRVRFRCYNPIDSESAFVQFPPIRTNASGEEVMVDLPKDYTYPYFDDKSHHGRRPEERERERDRDRDRDEASKQLDRQLFDDLKRRFRVIGDTSQMTKTICAIFIDYSEGKHIPAPCDCTHNTVHTDDTAVATSSETSFQIPNLYFRQKVHVAIGYDAKIHSHGVENHGSSFAKSNLTSDQKDLIQTVLRKQDFILYNVSRAVFDEQVREMEASYGIKLCDRWNRPR